MADIRSHNRGRQIVTARFEAAARLRALGLSYPLIGRRIGRDHTTAIHAVRRWSEIEARSSGDAA